MSDTSRSCSSKTSRKNYGAIEALRGSQLRDRPRRGGGAARRQWRRQVDPGEDHLRRAEGQPPAAWSSTARSALHLARRGQGGRNRDRLPGPLALHQCRRRRQFLHGPRDREAISSAFRSCRRRRWRTRSPRRMPNAGTKIPSLRTNVEHLSGGQRQAIELNRFVHWGGKLVLLDEPFAALGVEQTRRGLEMIKRIAAQGIGVVIITHIMAQAFQVADRIVVIRQGRVAGDVATDETSPDEVVRHDHRRGLRPRRQRRNARQQKREHGTMRQ